MEQQKEYTISWKDVDEIVFEALTFIQKPYPKVVREFLNWYEPMRGSMLPISDEKVRVWVIKGIPRMKELIRAINREQDIITRKINKIYSSSPRTKAREAMIASKELTEGEAKITYLKERLIGCGKDFGEWYLQLLEYLSTRYPEQQVFKNNIPYFANICPEE